MKLRGPVGARAAILVAWVTAAPLVAQDTPDTLRAVAAARMTAVVAPGQADVDVRLEYDIRQGADAPTDPVRIHALGVGDAEIEGFEIESPALPATGSGSLRVEQGVLRAGTLELPPGGAGGLVLRYRVRGAVAAAGPAVRVHLPLLVLDLPPAGTSPATFHATVQVPEAWSVAGTFPSGLAPGQAGTWSGSLQVVPAFVALRGRSDGRWRPGLDWALDLLTVLVLAGVGFVGWRPMRGVVREDRA